MKHLNWSVNPKLIRKFVDASGPFFDWLVEKGGAEEFFTKPAKQAADQQGGVPQGMQAVQGGP